MSNIFVTGYYGTGSSAIIDLLTEFDNIEIALGKRYEHVLFLCHDGLLDLEQRLFGENSNQMIRDVAINEFIKEMYKQNDHFFGWYGSYRYIFGQKFKALVDKFGINQAPTLVVVENGNVSKYKGVSDIKKYLGV